MKGEKMIDKKDTVVVNKKRLRKIIMLIDMYFCCDKCPAWDICNNDYETCQDALKAYLMEGEK